MKSKVPFTLLRKDGLDEGFAPGTVFMSFTRNGV
jgi:hypothetical protein